jgi:flagellar biosynthesis protein FlhG
MGWTDTRRKLLQLARDGLPSRVIAGRLDVPAGPAPRGGPPPAEERSQAARPRALSVCVASGKGGTGKSIVSAALAALLAPRGRTLIVDGDLGVGNAHILQDVTPHATCVDVVEGRLGVRAALVDCGRGTALLAAGSGVSRMAELTGYELHVLASGLAELEHDFAHVLVDSAAGVSSQTMALARACDASLIVTTPDLTAMTDAYAFLKLYFAGRAHARAYLLVNRAADAEEADEVTRRIARVGERFLGTAPRCVGWLPHDPVVSACVNRRGAVVALAPGSAVARGLARVAQALLAELAPVRPRGLGSELLRELGYGGSLR